jgi:hypothetical protein
MPGASTGVETLFEGSGFTTVILDFAIEIISMGYWQFASIKCQERSVTGYR